MVAIEFAAWVAIVATAAAFVLGLAVKWKILEWLQVHAPTEFISRLFNCKFCCSWWVCLGICVTLWVVTGAWLLMLVPICATVITRELW